MANEKPEAQAVFEIAKASLIPQVQTLADGDIKGDILLTPAGNGTFGATAVKTLLAPYRKAPERIEGTATLKSVQSFIDHVQRFKNDGSAVFANRDEPSLTAVYDYHRRDEPHFTKHRARYTFPVSDEWTAWTGKDGAEEAMNQTEFAEFIENRIADVVAPTPDMVKPESLAAEFISKIGAEYATPAKLLELSRGLEVRSATTLKNAVKLGSGETQLSYVEEHQGADGAPLRVPGAFLIGIPVFEGGEGFQLPVRLRYRKSGASLMWFFELYRPDKIFDVAFNEACDEVRTDTALPLFLGAPE